VIALDTNIIVHYLVSSSAEHPQVRTWFEARDEALGTTPTNVGEVLRLLTHPRVFPRPMKLAAACELVAGFLDDQAVTLLEEKASWLEDLGEIAEAIPTLRGNEVFDARIAICLRYNGVKRICTLDSDFAKYRFLEIVTPA
jgi:uncharacterized protein